MKIPVDKLGKASLWACLIGAVGTTVADIWCKIRHDKREAHYYATLELNVDSVKTKLLGQDNKEEA